MHLLITLNQRTNTCHSSLSPTAHPRFEAPVATAAACHVLEVGLPVVPHD